MATYPRLLVPVESVSVAPTATTMATFSVYGMGTVSIQVANADATQILSCTVQRRATPDMDFVDTSILDLSSINPGASAMVDVDPGGADYLRVLGVASGAGLTASIVVVQG